MSGLPHAGYLLHAIRVLPLAGLELERPAKKRKKGDQPPKKQPSAKPSATIDAAADAAGSPNGMAVDEASA